jgi:hypothetical protein
MANMIEVLKQMQEALREYHYYTIDAGLPNQSMLNKGYAAFQAGKKAIAELESQEPVSKYCCHLCFNKSGSLFLDRMILCSECGNKRCPKATNHKLQCTNSNDPNQVGSIYTHPPQRTWVGLTVDEVDDIANSILTDDPVLWWRKLSQAIEAKLKEKNT